MKRCLLLICALLLGCSAAMAEAVYTLPIDLSPGMPVDKANYPDENTYIDPTIEMRITTGTFEDAIWWMADIKVGDASQLRTMPANSFTSGMHAQGKRLSTRANAVLAINGDYYAIETNKKGKHVLRQGVLYGSELIGVSDVLAIDEAGDFHIFPKAEAGSVPEEVDGKKLINAFCFGPALVIDGKTCQTERQDFMASEEARARTALCQIGPLHYAVVCCSNPSTQGRGMTLQQFADLTGTLGVQTAYNLDGGNSTMMYTYGRQINKNGSLREISDIIYFASAWPGEVTP